MLGRSGLSVPAKRSQCQCSLEIRMYYFLSGNTKLVILCDEYDSPGPQLQEALSSIITMLL